MIEHPDLRRWGAIATLGLVLAVSSINSPDHLELGDSRDLLRNLLVVALSAGLVGFAGWPPTARIPTAAWVMLGWLGWAALTAPFTDVDPAGSMVTSMAALAAAVATMSLVLRYGFEAVLFALAPSMAVVMAFGALVEVGDGDSGRWAGLAFDFNAFGVLGVLGAVAASALIGRKGLSLLAFGAVIAGMAGVWQSGGRVSFVVALLGIGALVLRRVPTVMSRAVIVGIGLLALVVVSVNLEGVVESVARGGETEDVLGVNGRTDVWPLAIDGIAEAPLIGHGSTGSPAVLVRMRDSRYGLRFHAVHAHNFVLQVALTNGIPMAIVMVGALLAWGRRVLRSPLLERDVFGVVLVLVGLTEPLWFGLTPPILVLAAVLAALSLGEPEGHPEHSHNDARLATPVG